MNTRELIEQMRDACTGVQTMACCGQLDQFIGEPWLSAVINAITAADKWLATTTEYEPVYSKSVVSMVQPPGTIRADVARQALSVIDGSYGETYDESFEAQVSASLRKALGEK